MNEDFYWQRMKELIEALVRVADDIEEAHRARLADMNESDAYRRGYEDGRIGALRKERDA